MNYHELMNKRATADQAQIHALQLRVAEQAAELRALREQKPVGWEWWAEASELWLSCDDQGHANRCIKNGRTVRALYARPIPAEHTPPPTVAGGAAYPIPQEWRAAVIGARGQFQHYADLHRAKGTPDGEEKAQVNQDYADMLTALLERAK